MSAPMSAPLAHPSSPLTPLFTSHTSHTSLHLSHLSSPLFTSLHLSSPLFTSLHLSSPLAPRTSLFTSHTSLHLCPHEYLIDHKPAIKRQATGTLQNTFTAIIHTTPPINEYAEKLSSFLSTFSADPLPHSRPRPSLLNVFRKKYRLKSNEHVAHRHTRPVAETAGAPMRRSGGVRRRSKGGSKAAEVKRRK